MIASRTFIVAAALLVSAAAQDLVVDPCQDCDRQMRKVFEAMQAWRRSHGGDYPPSLADLSAAGLLPKDGASCPDVVREGPRADPRSTAQSSTGPGLDSYANYEYELSKVATVYLHPQFVPEDMEPKTRMDAKAPLLRRPHFEQVPVLRCSSHRESAPTRLGNPDEARRNLTTEGKVYWSSTYWELEWLDDVSYIARSAQNFFGLQGPPFHAENPVTLPGALDLDTWSSAFGDHPWWWDLPIFDNLERRQFAAALRPFFSGAHGRELAVGSGRYWIDGLAQLQGKTVGGHPFRFAGMESFPWEKPPVAVGRKFGSASWLQGTVWQSEPGEVAGWLRWRFADGEVVEVPMTVGETTGRFWAHVEDLEENRTPEPAWRVVEEVAGGENLDGTFERELRLYEQRWENPRPEAVVESVQFTSNRECTAAPFLVAITLHDEG